MAALNQMYLLNTVVDCFAALVLLVLLLGCLLERKQGRATSRLLAALLGVHIFDLLSDAAYWHLLDPALHSPMPVLQLLAFVNYASAFLFVALYAFYLLAHISQYAEIPARHARMIAAGCGTAVVLWVVNLFNGTYLYFDAAGMNYSGPMLWFSRGIGAILMGTTMLIVYKYRSYLGKRETLALMSYGILPLLSVPLQFFWETTPLLLATTLSLVMIYTVVHTEESRRAAEQEKLLAAKELELADNRVSIMLSQIQPHFLYNALTTIKYLCARQDPRAEDTVARFAKYLRGNMDSLSLRTPIPFERELDHLENYLAIERLRFPKVQIVYIIDTTAFTLPALTIQPLVENAIRYGVTRKKGGEGTVTVSSWEMDDAFYVSVQDDGVGFDPMQRQYDGRSHIGIANTRQRVEAMCGGELNIRSVLGEGTTVLIKLPKERKA